MSACNICWQPNGSHHPYCPVPAVRLYGPLIPAITANRLSAPTDHTAAIAEKAREYVRTRRAHLDHGPLLSARKAAHDALLAAVDAERAEREGKS